MKYPLLRMRRLRSKVAIQNLVREHRLSKEQLVYPIFLKEGLGKPVEIKSMPDQYQHSESSLIDFVGQMADKGLGAIMLFGIPQTKSAKGNQSYSKMGIVQKAMRKLKKKFPDILLIADCCLCEYTHHGHCGIVKGRTIVNDQTIDVLSKIAVSYAESGADVIAPSDMMDGRVQAIRHSLDSNRFSNVPILSYASKYNSAFYGPFRDAAENTPQQFDRSSYQMDPSNILEALREVALDIEEGADFILTKPASHYLDVVSRIKNEFSIPVGTYVVSGEYSMIKAASAKRWIDEKRAVMESHIACIRSGASFIVTYWTPKLVDWL